MKITLIALGTAVALLLEGNGMSESQAQNDALATSTKEYVYKQIPQGELKIFVDLPPGWSAEDRRPAIVFFFGGAWRAGSVRQFSVQAQYLASRGLVSLRPDYRVKSRHDVMPDKCVEDAKSAMRWVNAHAAELGIDPDRVIGSGGSAGGHLAACAAMTPGLDAEGDDRSISTRPCALVLFNPVLDMTGSEEMIARIGSKKTAELISPTLHMTEDAPPAIMFYGTKDRMLAMGEAYCTKAKELGAHAEMYTAEGEGHAFFNKAPWKEKTLYLSDEFLVKLGYLEGEPTLEVPAEGEEMKQWAP